MEEAKPTTSGGYGKRPLWQWIVIYVILGAIIYGAIYYFFLRGNSSYSYSTNSPDQYSAPVK